MLFYDTAIMVPHTLDWSLFSDLKKVSQKKILEYTVISLLNEHLTMEVYLMEEDTVPVYVINTFSTAFAT